MTASVCNVSCEPRWKTKKIAYVHCEGTAYQNTYILKISANGALSRRISHAKTDPNTNSLLEYRQLDCSSWTLVWLIRHNILETGYSWLSLKMWSCGRFWLSFVIGTIHYIKNLGNLGNFWIKYSVNHPKIRFPKCSDSQFQAEFFPKSGSEIAPNPDSEQNSSQPKRKRFRLSQTLSTYAIHVVNQSRSELHDWNW